MGTQTVDQERETKTHTEDPSPSLTEPIAQTPSPPVHHSASSPNSTAEWLGKVAQVMSVSPTNTPAPTSTTLPPSDSKTNAVNLSSHYIPVTVSVKTSYSLRQLHVQPWSNPTAKRNRKLAEALGINVSLGNSGGSGFGNVVYNGELVAFGMVNANFWGLWRGLSQTSSRRQRSRNIFTQLLSIGSDWKFDVREIETKRPIHPPHRHTSQYSNPPPYPSTSTSPTCDWDHHSCRTTSSLGKLADPRRESITPSSLAAAASSTSLWKPCN
ncbi:hypothetical protein D9758_012603 [Tetrapyrgos nigripes]|uniref:Uncharacterized protein n=1 Tax=Tetrapyrgos nigripes TaxID=182062 RepID=A0A8H5GE18_9AGAR|nr:hypothetical protein D9758_012603 [Tetrapyrgos nigripes]